MPETTTSELAPIDIARAIGWFDAMDDRIQFDSADWSTVNEDGRIIVEGYADLDEGRHYIRADFALIGFHTSYCPEDDDE